MSQSLTAFLVALGAVTLAEMGDKTQLLAMAFATKYKAYKVMWGVLIATVLNHALAVALGTLVIGIPSLKLWIQVLASLSFIVFGLWTIRGDKLEGEDKRPTRFGPILTVAIAFFFAEVGDKTQLTTIALAAKMPTSPIWILAGTTIGMLVADGIGILVGVVLCKRIPERTIKLISAAVFVIFGFSGSYEVLRNNLKVSMPWTLGILAVVAVITLVAGWKLYKANAAVDTERVGENCAIGEKE